MDKIEKAEFNVIDIANFWMHVKKVHFSEICKRIGKCWEWQGTFFNSGYGHFICHQKSYRAHRVAYYIYHGKISNDKFICHRCDNPKCVNPLHLWEGSAQDNMKDRDKKCRYKTRGKSKNKNKYFGVYFRKDCQKWRAKYTLKYKSYDIGTYETEIEAAKAYDEKIKELGLNKPLNFPLNTPKF